MFEKIKKISWTKHSFLRKKQPVWSGDTFIFEETSGKQIATPKSHAHLGTSFNSGKAVWLIFLMAFVFLIIIGRLFFIQIISGENYFQAAEGNREKKIPIPAERGQIFDRNNIRLTQNIPNFSLAIIPHKLPTDKKELNVVENRLSEITGKTKEEIEKIIKDFASYSYESIVISEDLNYEQALSIQIAASDLPGIHIQRGSKRFYANWLSISHILGYQSKIDREELDNLYTKGYLPSDYIGKTGLEKQYENLLRGVYGVTRLEVNAFGKEQSVLSETPPVSGKNLQLTIDMDSQKKMEEILNKTIKEQKKQRAAAVVMNPNNGEILALVSLPAFNNNDFSGGIDFEIYKSYIENKDNPLFNRAISGSYPSGSTIKPAIASAALEEGIINERTSFLSKGGINVGEWFFPDWLAGGHGITNVRRSLAWSVNTFYYYIGGGYKNFTGLGIDKITTYLRLFGLDSQLGIDLPSENKGFLPSKEWKENVKKENWYIGDTYNVSIGQGDVLVTPLQIAFMTATVANGGILYKPHVLKSIIDPVTLWETKIEPEIIRSRVVSPSNIKIVRLGMKDCVDYGSCRRLLNLPMSSAGKTGTAQWHSTKDPHAWFTVFAPFENPQVVVTILVEEGGSGSNAAVSIADEFLNWWWINKAK